MTAQTTTQLVPVSGNTYPVKDSLRALGGRWNADSKCWMVPAEKLAEAQKLIASAGPEKAFSGGGSTRRYECSDCGDTVYSGTRCWETGLRH